MGAQLKEVTKLKFYLFIYLCNCLLLFYLFFCEDCLLVQMGGGNDGIV